MDDPNTIAETDEITTSDVSAASDVGLVGVDAADEPSGDEPVDPTESTALVVTEPTPLTLESLAERVARLEAFLTPGHVSDFADLDPID